MKMLFRTKVKICGLTRAQDVTAAIIAGVDAIGFVFYRHSMRYIAPNIAMTLITKLPPFISTVGLFVNATIQEISEIYNQVSISLLQFHGDETPDYCAKIAEIIKCPFLHAVRVEKMMSSYDLLKYEQNNRNASTLFSGLVLDTLTKEYGGSGKTFDWSIIPKKMTS